jgi:Tol biopolymer transport system component
MMRAAASFLVVFAALAMIAIAVASGGGDASSDDAVLSPKVATLMDTPAPYKTFGPSAPTPTREPERGDLETTLIDVETGGTLALWKATERVGTAAFSPDGRWLVFGRGDQEKADTWQLYRIDLQSPNLEAEYLVSGFLSSSISPYSNRGDLAFWDTDSGRLTVMSAEGTMHQLARPGYLTSWSPDGLWLTYGARYTADDEPMAQYLVNTETWRERTFGASLPCGCDANPRPGWAPDSRRFIYTYIAGEGWENREFVSGVYGLDGELLTRVEPNLGWSADWLDASHYLFKAESPRSAGYSDIYGVDINTGERELLFESLSDSLGLFSPDWTRYAAQSGQVRIISRDGQTSQGIAGNLVTWSPDGRYLLTYFDASIGRFILVHSADGERLLASIPVAGFRAEAAFAMDSRFLAYVKSLDDAATGLPSDSNDIYVVDLETGEEQLMAHDLRGDIYCLAWSPDSRFLVVGYSCGL